MAKPTHVPRWRPSWRLRARPRSTYTRSTTNAQPSRARAARDVSAPRQTARSVLRTRASPPSTRPRPPSLTSASRTSPRPPLRPRARAPHPHLHPRSFTHTNPAPRARRRCFRRPPRPRSPRRGTQRPGQCNAAPHAGRSCSLPRLKRAQACPMCSRTSRGASSCAGNGRRRKRRGPTLPEMVVQCISNTAVHRKRHIGLRAALRDAGKKPHILSGICVYVQLLFRCYYSRDYRLIYRNHAT